MVAQPEPRSTVAQDPLTELRALGQSPWLDFIDRKLLVRGALQRRIERDGLRGLTSNPSIFQKAIASGEEYRADLAKMKELCTRDPAAAYEQLAIADIQRACDLFAPVYRDSARRDGYASLEANPRLAHDTPGTLAEVRRLWRAVGRDNVMIKVPGTPAGVPAIETLIGEGINVNVTLLFSVEAYAKVAEAHTAGLETLLRRGGDPSRVAGVASFFVSRVDTACDPRLDERAKSGGAREQALARELRGKIGIANAKRAFQLYTDWVEGPRWRALAARGAMTQRLLWASTSTKDPAYRDVMYVEELIGRDTVNSLPPETLDAFRDHGRARPSLTEELARWLGYLERLPELGIDLEQVCAKLLEEGVQKFDDAFDKLLAAVAAHGK